MGSARLRQRRTMVTSVTTVGRRRRLCIRASWPRSRRPRSRLPPTSPVCGTRSEDELKEPSSSGQADGDPERLTVVGHVREDDDRGDDSECTKPGHGAILSRCSSDARSPPRIRTGRRSRARKRRRQLWDVSKPIAFDEYEPALPTPRDPLQALVMMGLSAGPVFSNVT
jgi:hypothetical protein